MAFSEYMIFYEKLYNDDFVGSSFIGSHLKIRLIDIQEIKIKFYMDSSPKILQEGSISADVCEKLWRV